MWGILFFENTTLKVNSRIGVELNLSFECTLVQVLLKFPTNWHQKSSYKIWDQYNSILIVKSDSFGEERNPIKKFIEI